VTLSARYVRADTMEARLVRYPKSFEMGLDNLEAISRTRVVAWSEYFDQLAAPILAGGWDLEQLSAALSKRDISLPLRGEAQPSGETQRGIEALVTARSHLRAAIVRSDVGVNAAAAVRGEAVTLKDAVARNPFSVEDLRAMGADTTHRFARQALEAGVSACKLACETEVVDAWTEFERTVNELIESTIPTSLHKAIALSKLYEVPLYEVWPHIVLGHQKATAVFENSRGYKYAVYAGWWLWRTVAAHHHPVRAAPDFDEWIGLEIRGPRAREPIARATEMLPILEHELAATVRILGDRNLRVAAVLHRLGNARSALGEPQAREAYERSLRLREELLGPDHLDVGATLLSFSSWCAKEDELELAEALGVRALEIFERHPGKGDSFIAAQLNNLGNLYVLKEMPEQAERAFLRLIDQPRPIGPDDRHVHASLTRLGELYKALGRPDEAQSLHERSRRIAPLSEDQ
jgi:tetratricopeptide (TPR) repeat protein